MEGIRTLRYLVLLKMAHNVQDDKVLDRARNLLQV